jgi:uncharacterized protein
VVFKRRNRRSLWQVVREAFYPKGGWTRAFHYVKHRVSRLPDTPEKIARGICAGVFASFTPFYGFHFLLAALGAWLLRGNIIASLLGTFFGNPLTYVPIGGLALQTGHFLLGSRFVEKEAGSFRGSFAAAAADLWENLLAIFTDQTAEWSGLARFNNEVFLPYLVGGTLAGLVTATICYYLSVPVIRAYQNRRKGRLKEKLAELRAKAAGKSDEAK